MKLLLDLGNTRLKWGMYGGGRWRAQGALAYDRLEHLAPAILAAGRPETAVGANVAGGVRAAEVGKALPAGLDIAWNVAAERQCGVVNGYLTAGQLGADRWAALIGARHLHRGAALVVMAGTATTVDVLAADGRFEGGLILPGLMLMRRSLAADTSDLRFADGCHVAHPRRTEDAIVSGCMEAQAGAIERMFARLDRAQAPLCLLGGGTAELIAPLLRVPCRRVDNLVLEGLARIAEDRANITP
ncbi:MAG: type III pantothenate kinase [Rhodocyclaceae bacterium]|nr:type III pantothenate kinase [Rhodocyclaceae bacterium]